MDGDEMAWNWMEQFLYWAKANSQSGSQGGADGAGSPPASPSSGSEENREGGIPEARGARGKEVGATFGAVGGGGIEEGQEDRAMR